MKTLSNSEMVRLTAITFFAVLAIGPWFALASEQTDETELTQLEYAADIAPLLERYCLRCHGPEKQESNFRVDLRASLLAGGDFGEPGVVVSKSGESHLIRLVAGLEGELVMPPEGKGERLTAEEIGLLRRWIDDGLEMPANAGDAQARVLTHWSFQPVKRPTPPALDDSFVGGAIDAFVLEKLRANKLQPSSQADRRTLIRRLYLVMHGLPPTPKQVEQFVHDDSSDAWKKLVNNVLASPRYGERWGRHWLDLVRFGETTGFETNRERPNAWPYRDYVIQSLNEDKPFNQFAREQIAGDAVGDPLGTGFLVAGPNDIVKGGGNLAAVQRTNELDDMINATGTTFLGLTLGCARCHNHKFDPVTQADYYAVKAVFEGVQHGERTLPVDQEKLAALIKQASELGDRLADFVPLASTKPDEQPARRPQVNALHNVERCEPRLAKFVRFTVEATNQSQPCIDELEIFADGKNIALASAGAKATSGGDFVHAKHKLLHINDGRYGNSRSWIAADVRGWVQIELAKPAKIDRIEWARDREGVYADRLATTYRIETATEPGEWELLASSADRRAFVAAKAKTIEPAYDFAVSPEAADEGRQWLTQLELVQAEIAALQSAGKAYIGTFKQPGPTHRLYRGEPNQPREAVTPGGVSALTKLKLLGDSPEQQRRVALANWIASDDNPLTSRVIVNRLWQHHFGTGLVDTPSDFGRNGSPPTHGELLDHLAADLVANGWSLKNLHRQILLSNTWQQDSRPRLEAKRVDGTSRLLWRFPPRRLEAEAIRDNMLAVSGVLDLKMGGPGFSGFEVQPENVRHYFPKKSYGPADWRRMVYMTKVRQEQESVFGAFDCPDAGTAVPARSRSTTPLQAFNLFNSAFVLQQAELFANRLEKQEPKDEIRRAALATQLAFGRPATDGQVRAAAAFAAEHGWPALCRALFNANEFVFIP